RLEGTIDGAEFSLGGKFKLGANNKARRLATTVVIAGQETTLEAFHQQIGLTDPSTYHNVFRIEGADGHRVGDAEAVVAQAGAGVFGPIDPHEIADRFEASAKKLGKSTAAAADSVQTREAAIADLVSQLDEAGRNAAEYGRQLEAVEDANARRVKIGRELSRLRQKQSAFGPAKAITTAMAEARTLRSLLEQSPRIPAEWTVVVDNLAELELAHRELGSRQGQMERAIEDGAKASERTGRSLEELALLVIDETVTTQLTSAAQEAEQAAATELDLKTARTSAVEAVSRTHKAASTALSELGPVAQQQNFDPTLAKLGDTGLSLVQSAEAVRSAVTQNEQAKHSVTSARAAVQAAQIRLESTEQQYRSFNMQVEPEGLLAGAVAPAALNMPGFPGAGVAGWFAPVALAALALGAVLSGQYPLAALAALGAVLAVVLQTRRSDAPASLVGDPAAGGVDAAREAAMDVRDARRVIPGLEETAFKAEGDFRRTSELLDTRRRELSQALGDAGLPIDIAPEHVASVLGSWRRAADSFTEWRSASTALRNIEERLAVASSGADAATLRLETALAQFKIVSGGATAVAAALGALARDAEVARNGVHAQQELADLRHRVTELLSPVGLGADDAVDAIQRAKFFEAAMQERSRRKAKIAEIDQSIATALEASATAAELVKSDPDTTRLEAREREIGYEIDETDRELQQAVADAAGAASAADSMLDVQRVTELQEKISSHDAAANDLAIEAFAASLAHLLVEEEAAREERSRRPVLIERTSEIATSVAREWARVRAIRPPTGERGVRLVVDMTDGAEVPAHQLSTGARFLLYLSLRIAVADGLSAIGQP
ncbi:MAG TPA: hypothetical protein VL068_03225, partial [Microthrixaceae bacterium]|nr:hypothetical protein [Microthrixaceae bacterium]